MSELSLPRSASFGQALAVSAAVTLAVTAIAALLPQSWHTTLVGFAFLAAVWLLVWRKDDARVHRAGLALGGLVIPGRLPPGQIARAALTAIGWASALMALVAIPYFFAWRWWWAPRLTFSLGLRPADAADEVLGQLLVIALPEEAFYRGYLQSQLNEVWAPRWNVLGARIGPGLFAAAAIFAVGHLATVQVPARLAVFFPALVFGWLRARTGGIGASVFFHAGCNLYSLVLGRGYGLY
jgi:hypothetical protein